MDGSERHNMYLEKIHPSGVEEWHCATCDKCVLVTWKPLFSIATREPDGTYVIHRISKDGSQVESTEATSLSEIVQPEDPRSLDENARLVPWNAWMEETGFERLWDDEN